MDVAAANPADRLQWRYQRCPAIVCGGNGKAQFPGLFLERTMGLEPTTLSLGS